MSLDMRLFAVSVESGFGRVRINGRGLERPTFLIRCVGPGQYSRVRRPSLGLTELPAAIGSLFARG